MESHVLKLMAGARDLLSTFLEAEIEVSLASERRARLVPEGTYLPAPEEAPEDLDHSGVDTEAAVPHSDAPSRLVPSGTYLPDPEPVAAPEETKSADAKEFPLTPKQIMTCKRKQLRDLVDEYELPIVGKDGETPSEMFVGSLREAICIHLRSQEMAKEMGKPSSPEIVGQGIDVLEDTPPWAESNLDAPPLGAAMADLAEAMKLPVKAAFLEWVSDQTSKGSEHCTNMASDLESFFSTNLDFSRGTERQTIDAYFDKMGCAQGEGAQKSIPCSNCPRGSAQPLYCYGVFDEEVKSLDVRLAAEENQLFMLDTAGNFVHQPSI